MLKHTTKVDVTDALPPAAGEGEPITVVVDPANVASQPVVMVAIPGGMYHRRYWDLQPPGRTGVDGMTPGYATPFAEVIGSPVFLGWVTSTCPLRRTPSRAPTLAHAT